jgi:exopolysaccharide production protein ExoY
MFYAGQNDRVGVPGTEDPAYGAGGDQGGSDRVGRPVGGFWKRILDVGVAAAALVLLMPLLALVSLLLLASGGRPILQKQPRVGFAGRRFHVYTFRTGGAFGELLQRSGIDGLPRLVNVLKGDMSCVGPRPLVADEAPADGADAYVQARPGMTGTWMLEAPMGAKADTDYVHNWSMQGDIVILLRAIPGLARSEQHRV